MTTIKLSGGDFGREEMMVRCDLSQASAPVQVDYCEGDGWVGCQYQCADTRHTTSGLVEIAKELAARALEMRAGEFSCAVAELSDQYVLTGSGGRETADTLADAVALVADWYDYMADDERYAGIEIPAFHPRGQKIKTLADLGAAVTEWEAEIATACGHKDFSGHGNYHVSAADEMGLDLRVTMETVETAIA